MRGVRVSLSSGDVFYLDATLEEAQAAVSEGAFLRFPGRVVSTAQVAQLLVAEVPSIETPELLEAECPAG